MTSKNILLSESTAIKNELVQSVNISTTSAIVKPTGSLQILSLSEMEDVQKASTGALKDIFRRCALAVLNSGASSHDSKEMLEQYQGFTIQVVLQGSGLRLELINAPARAFVDGKMIQGIKELLFAVLRDIIYTHNVITVNPKFDLSQSSDITNAVFHILRNADVLKGSMTKDMVVCWGGHSISRAEYEYTKEVGYELGLRGLNICTGCGAGVMKGPMKGATIAHAKQRIDNGRYLGITEPGIIAAESPNPIVNDLVIMPDIEKRLEAFVRVGHGIIVFPGGVGTAEEILYIIGILQDPKNSDMPLPLIFTGPKESEGYFQQIDAFLVSCFGERIKQHYQIFIDKPVEVAQKIKEQVSLVRDYRIAHHEPEHFNWLVKIDEALQEPFIPNHTNMAQLALNLDMPAHELAINLRRVFSGIVAGNVKEEGMRQIEEHGPFNIKGDAGIMRLLDRLLEAFVTQNRMKLPGKQYRPCYRIVT